MGLSQFVRVAAASLLLVLVSGCLQVYRYQSQGRLWYGEESRDAVLYWFVDQGRLWYGKAYRQSDSSVVMRVCGAVPKSFQSADDPARLQLPSRAGDRKSVV